MGMQEGVAHVGRAAAGARLSAAERACRTGALFPLRRVAGTTIQGTSETAKVVAADIRAGKVRSWQSGMCVAGCRCYRACATGSLPAGCCCSLTRMHACMHAQAIIHVIDTVLLPPKPTKEQQEL